MLPVLADAQIYIDSYRFGVPPDPGFILDTFPGAAAAYSFRKLDNDYTGNCIVVQRDNGDTSAIGFAGNFLDTAAMKTFCGEGAGDSCRVRLWYDQSGNNRYVRSTTASIMPLIMKDGIVVRIGGRVAMDFDTLQYLTAQLNTDWNFLHQSGFSYNFGVSKAGNVADPDALYLLWGNSVTVLNIGSFLFFDDRAIGSRNDGLSHVIGIGQVATNITNNVATANTVFLHTIYGNPNNATLSLRSGVSTNGSAFINNNTQSATASANNATYPLSFGAARNVSGVYGVFLRGQIFEQIFYASDKTSDRAAIETNINTFYSIY
jgi:urease alpha subunit